MEGVLVAAVEGVLVAGAVSEVGRGGKGRAALAGETVRGGAGAAEGASVGGGHSLPGGDTATSLGAITGAEVEVEVDATEAVEDDDCKEVATEVDTVDVVVVSVDDEGEEVAVVVVEEGVAAEELDEVTAGFFRSC